MGICRFADFTFDPRRLELRRQGSVVAMRPKTAALLRVLLADRGQIVGKRELFQRVWKTEHVQDQSLFQAISEIRKTLAPLKPILTHPNLGYEWVAPVTIVRGQHKLRWHFAAAAALVFAVTATLATQRTSTTARSPTVMAAKAKHAADTTITHSAQVASTQLPALQAFALGIQSLQSQRPADAEDFFLIAARENPGFHEAALMVAESLLQQGRYDDAIARAEQVLNAAADDRYASVAAMDLLSKISQRSGRSQSALRWAEDAAAEARLHGLACAVDDTADRLAGLLDEAGLENAGPMSVDQTRRNPRQQTAPAGSSDGGALANEHLQIESPAYCTGLRELRPAEPSANAAHCASVTPVFFAATQPTRARKTLV